MAGVELHQGIIDAYVAQLRALNDRMASNVKVSFKKNKGQNFSGNDQFFKFLEQEISYTKDPIVFAFAKYLKIDLVFENSRRESLVFTATEFPGVQAETEHPGFHAGRRVHLASSRQIFAEVRNRIANRDVKSASLIRAPLHQKYLVHVRNLFADPEFNEVANALWIDRSVWWKSGTVWPHNMCTKCGLDLTHPVSKVLGVGPECGGHQYELSEDFLDGFNDVVARFKSTNFFAVPAELNPIIWVRLDKIAEIQRSSR